MYIYIMKKTKISITIDPILHNELKVFAKKNRSTVSATIDNAVWALMNPAPTVIRNSEKPKKARF